MSKIKPLARRSEIVIQEFGNEILIYDLRINKAFNLNETSSLIWQLSDGDKTIPEIAENLSQKFNSTISEEFVWLALEQLRKEKLIENETQIADLYGGVSRREIIRRVGFATMVALPIVSSLVAPMAINAASVCDPANTCLCPPSTLTFCNVVAPIGAQNGNPGTIVCGTPTTCRCEGPFIAANPPVSPSVGAVQQLGNCSPP